MEDQVTDPVVMALQHHYAPVYPRSQSDFQKKENPHYIFEKGNRKGKMHGTLVQLFTLILTAL